MNNSDIALYDIEQLSPARSSTQFRMLRLEEVTRRADSLRVPHRNNFYTVMLVLGGSGEHNIDFTTYKFKANDVYFISPGQIYTFNSIRKAHGYVFLFTAEFFSLRYNNNVLLEFPFFHSHHNLPHTTLPKDKQPQIQHLIQMLEQEYADEQPHREKVLRSYLNILLFELHRIYTPLTKQAEAPSHLGIVRHFEQLIEEHFRNKKHVHEYADLLFISPNYLNSIVNKVTGKSAGQMIRERVMIEAKRLLIHTENTVAEVAYELDFNDNSYFTRFFKKYARQTPEEFRGRYKNGL